MHMIKRGESAANAHKSGGLEGSRRDFLKVATLAGGAAAFGSVGVPDISRAEAAQLTPRQVPLTGMATMPGKANHWYVPASDQTVHWGYLSKRLTPVIEVEYGDYVTVECLTHQAGDDPGRMIKGDSGAESVYYWTKDKKNVDRRGAGPMDAPNGAGAGDGVHVMTGPIAFGDAEQGDILEVRVLDMYPRPCANPQYQGKTFGTNIAAWWGYQYGDLLGEPNEKWSRFTSSTPRATAIGRHPFIVIGGYRLPTRTGSSIRFMTIRA